MRYTNFRDTIGAALAGSPGGLTWAELKKQLKLPYERACPEWVRRLETEIGLKRMRGEGAGLVWKVGNRRRPSNKK